MSPPLPPPGIQDFFALPTLNLMAILIFLMQFFVIAVNARHINQQYKGIWALLFSALALLLHYSLLTLSVMNVLDRSAPWMQGIREIFNIAGHTLIYVAVCQFLGISFNRYVRYMLYVLVPIVLVAGFIPGLPSFRPLTLSILIILDMVSAWVLLSAEEESYAKGARLTAIPLAIYAVVTLIRIFLLDSTGPDGQPGAAGPSIPGIFEMLSLFMCSFLWTSAYIFMISQRLQNDLNDLAMKDMLTRVKNRRAMHGLLNFEMRRVQRDVQEFSIILLDVDHFKRVNDTYGHDVGDLVLQWMAQTMQTAIREQDVVSRWGGEEFLVLLPATGLDEALEVAERLRQTIESSAAPNPTQPLKITFSAGVACSKWHENVDELCKAADQALYRAKQTRNRVLSEKNSPFEDDRPEI